MCRLFKVNRGCYYDWLNKEPSVTKQENKLLAEKVKKIFIRNRSNYGTRRIKRELAKEGIMVSRRRIKTLMRKQELYCKSKRKFKVTTDSKHSLPIAPNLLQRNFSPSEANQCYVGDITYIPTQEGWLYLAVVIDLYSRRVVGWSMQEHMQASLVNDALYMALCNRNPPKGLLWHTDRGSQYASDSHRQLLKEYGIIQSMSRKGNCWDNAVSESFFHTLKVELVHQLKFQTREEAKQSIFEYIEVFYNRFRMHSSNDYLSPMEYEEAQ